MIDHNRAKAVDAQFCERVRSGELPALPGRVAPEEAGLDREDVLDLFESQLLSRALDLAARALRAQNQGFYTIGSAGHEGNAGFGKVFRASDMAFLHYRSGGFVLQRAKRVPGATPLYDTLLGLVASSEDPISGGRHKVWGSVELNVPPQTSTIASHLPKAVGAALSVPRAAHFEIEANLPYDSLVVCSFGDASVNHAVALAGLNTARWCAHLGIPLPLVLICEDNSLGISVRTPSTWIGAAQSHSPDLKYFPCDGRDLCDVVRCAREVDAYVRKERKPAFVHMRTVRLLGHAGSDVEVMYHTERDILKSEADDPLLHTARLVLEREYLRADEILDVYEQLKERVSRIAARASLRPKLADAPEVMRAIVPPPREVPARPLPPEARRRRAFDEPEWRQLARPQPMSRLLNWGLRDLLLQYPELLVFGEDVAKKGGVYGVTLGLQKKFGNRRVFDTLLDETSILGAALGFAHNGFLPIPEIQFLAYVHNAQDQLRGEAATLPFFSDGQFANPMVVRVAGLAYQQGFGGHFHNDNSLAVFRDVPGLIIACPSNGADAVKLLRRCVSLAYRERRVVVFVEPIALYGTRDLHAPSDRLWERAYPERSEQIALGELGVHGDGRDLAVVTYGNGVHLSLQAAKVLGEEHGIDARVVDLRWLAPLNTDGLMEATRGIGRVLIVDECRRTGSQSEALVTAFAENADPLPRLRRVTAEDSFIPLGEAARLVLPSREQIVRAAVELVT